MIRFDPDRWTLGYSQLCAHEWTPDASPHTNYLQIFKEHPEQRERRSRPRSLPRVQGVSTQKPCCTKPPGPSFSGLPEIGAAQYSGPFRGVNDCLKRSGFAQRHAGKTAFAGLQKVACTGLQDRFLGADFLAVHLDRALLDQPVGSRRAGCQAGVLQDVCQL